jgi:hypothetical protein
MKKWNNQKIKKIETKLKITIVIKNEQIKKLNKFKI